MGCCGRVLRQSSVPMHFTLRVTSSFFSWYFLILPQFVRKWVPHSSGILSIGFLYVFAQALGLMWLLVVNLCSIFSVGFVEHVQGYLANQGLDASLLFQRALTGYTYYCILRVIFFIGVSFYTIGWEAFSDFPTVRRLVVGGRSTGPAEGSSRAAGQAGGQTPLRQNGFYDIDELKREGSGTYPDSEDMSPRPSMGLQGNLLLRRQITPVTSDDDRGTTAQETSGPDAQDSPDTRRSPFIRSVWRRPPLREQQQPPLSSPRQRAVAKYRRQRFFREATLVAPLLGLIACTLALSTVVAACHVNALTCDGSDGVVSLTTPTGMLNRGVRFALLVSFLQWVQQFIYLFPTWHRGLLASKYGIVWEVPAILMLPVTMCRFGQWSFMPSKKASWFYQIPVHAIDVSIILFWKVWMLVSCLVVLKRPDVSGFKQRMIEEEEWSEMAALFKYSFLVPAMLHFARGCLMFGFAGAQSDLLVVVCTYPLLLASVWTLVWAVVVAPGRKLLLAGAAGSLILAGTICRTAGLRQGPGTVVVWLHLMRQYLKIFGKRRAARKRLASQQELAAAVKKQSAAPPEARQQPPPPAAADRQPAPEGGGGAGGGGRDERARRPSQTPRVGPERNWGNVIIILLGLVASGFSGVLLSLATVSSIQQRIDWYPTTIWFEREESPPALRVDHLISRVRLQIKNAAGDSSAPGQGIISNSTALSYTATDRAGGVSYATCGHLWHGLTILDYALLSLASYFDLSDPSLPLLLDGIFPEETGLAWRLRNFSRNATGGGRSRLSWIEVEVQQPGAERPLLVIAVRGTDPVRVSDYVEDIRMWTEPVSISILSTVFPTVRAWPRRTAELVITGIHDLLDSFGIPDNRWSYTELVEHVLKIPRDRYSQLVLTGHSLGGGTATVVAALTHLPVVGITPPGIYWSIAKHTRSVGRAATGLSDTVANEDISSWMHHESLTLVVENDWVNGIFDDHGGLVQMMTCDRSQESLQLACHMLEGTICHLFARCGDRRGRFEKCVHEYVLTDHVPSTTAKVLSEALPSQVKQGIAALLAWIEQPGFPDFGIPLSKVLLLLAFLVLLLVIGSATEELLLF